MQQILLFTFISSITLSLLYFPYIFDYLKSIIFNYAFRETVYYYTNISRCTFHRMPILFSIISQRIAPYFIIQKLKYYKTHIEL